MNTDNQPLVSVIVPTYNRANLISRAIKSILSQTYQKFEIIIVDDCSTDNISEVLSQFTDSRIRYIRNQENKGGSGARNVGIEASQAEYTAFLDDDDEWMSTKLEKQMRLFLEGEENLGVVTCARAKYQEGGKILENWPECKGNVYDYLVNTWKSFGTSTAIIKRTCLDQAGYFDASLPANQELDLFIRLAKVCEFDYVNEILIFNHIYPDRIGGNIRNGIGGKTIVLEKIERDMTRDARSKHRLELGQYYTYAGDIKSARKEFIKSIKAQPLQWKSYTHLALSLLGLKLYLNCILSRHKNSKELVPSKE